MRGASPKSADTDSTRGEERRPWSQLVLLRPDNQAVIGVFLIAGLIVLAGFWLWHGWMRQDIVEIDTVEPIPYRFTVDINTASPAELAQLPDVGETLAARIVEARQKSGGFRSIDELQSVPGIGPKTFDKVRPYLRPISAEEK
jgi:competence protein ComEA